MKNLDMVVLDVASPSTRARKNDLAWNRKYDYFRKVINMINLEQNHQMIRLYKVMCRLGQIKHFEDVSIGGSDLKPLVKRYNEDISNKYEITHANETPTKIRYYLNRKPDSKNVEEVISVDTLTSEKTKVDRDQWCINWAINNIISKFKELGYGSKFNAKDLIGKEHPYCERTKFYIDNKHVAEARRIINKDCNKYGFYLSEKYVIYPVDANIGW